MTIKIAVIGPAGSGKTILIAKLEREFKSRGKIVKIIEEVARSSPWAINEDADFMAQRWIFEQQILKELEAEYRNPDIIICDRGITDNICYMGRICDLHKPFPITEFLQKSEIARFWSLKYDHIIRMPLNIGWLKEDGIRSTDVDFARDIDERINNIIKEFNLKNITKYRQNFNISKFCDKIAPKKKTKKVTTRKRNNRTGVKP